MRLRAINIKWNEKSLVYIQIIFVLFMLFLRDVLSFPSVITYFTDVVLVLLAVQSFYNNPKLRIYKDALPQFVIVGFIVFFMFFGAVMNWVEPLLFIWGLRNNLRFFIFFFICVNLLELSDVDNFLNIFQKFYWANLVVCVIQYYGFGLKADYLGGFFGTTRGCNGYLNVFLCIVCAISFANFLVAKMKMWLFSLYLASVLYISILAELKVFYFELVLMIVAAVVLTKPSVKTISITLVCVVGLLVGLGVLAVYDPETLGVLLDLDALELYLSGTGYTSSGDLNRFTAIGQISKQFFGSSIFYTLFGFGLGGCEYSQFSFLQSEFSQQYGELKYRWFTHAWVYLEQGAIGLILLFVFFVSLLIYVCKKVGSVNKYYMIIAITFLPTCMLGLLYNIAIQIECCYIIALVCAIPFIANKSTAGQGGTL